MRTEQAVLGSRHSVTVTIMDVKTVEIKLQAGELITMEADNLHVRFSAYSIFCLVCDKAETYTGFLSCTCCKKIIKHDLHLSGTTHLNRHASTHSKATTAQPTLQPKITGFVTKNKVLSATDVAALRTPPCGQPVRQM